MNLILAESVSHFIVFIQALKYMFSLNKSGGSTCAYKPVPVTRLIADPRDAPALFFRGDLS